MTLTLPLPDKALSPNARVHAIRKSTFTRRARQLAFFATLKALGVPTVPNRILMGDRPNLGITHKKPLRSEDYRKISALLLPAQPPTFSTYSLSFHFPQERNRDDDNAAASCKAYRDGIADALRIDDSTLRIAADPALLIDRQRPRLEITLTIQDWRPKRARTQLKTTEPMGNSDTLQPLAPPSSGSPSSALLAVDPFKTLPLTFILKDSEWCYAESTKDIERQVKDLCEKAMALGLNVTRTRLAGADEMVITISSANAAGHPTANG